MLDPAEILTNLTLERVEMVVEDLDASTRWLVEGYGFTASRVVTGLSRATVEVNAGSARIRLCKPLVREDRGSVFLTRHGDGVADLGLGVTDVEAAFGEAVRRGAEPVRPPGVRDGTLCATIGGFGDVTHTFVEVPAQPHDQLGQDSRPPGSLHAIDHFAVVLDAGQLDPTVGFYQRVLGFQMLFTEHIVVGAQGMNSKVVRSASGAVTLTLIEPDVSRPPGQIDEFLARHGGPGIQHIAFNTEDIVEAIERFRGGGQEFLHTPRTYYGLLGERLSPIGHSIESLAALSILVDEDHYGQLFQIFARSVHPRNTFFMEVIERIGARTFGTNNIKALYEAVELQRLQKDQQADAVA